ncbi:response regulator [Flavobacterium sp.]
MTIIDIFYTDDDEDDLMLFSDAIEKIVQDSDKQINLHLHNNSNDFIEQIKNKVSANSIVFLDINMPCKSGYEVLQEIRNEPNTKMLPTIMFSTSADTATMSKCQWLGATHYAVKPSDFKSLIKIISSLIDIDWNTYNSSNEIFLLR